MLSSSSVEDNNSNSKSSLTSSSSSSSSYSPLISPSSTLSLSTNQAHFIMPQSMEEVWKDIHLSSLHTPSGFNGVILQDFLARPFSKDPSTTRIPPVGYGSSPPPPPPAPSRPSPPFLNLNSDPDHHQHHLQFLGTVNLDAPPISYVGPPRILADDVLLTENGRGAGGERRHKRMIKNRESAARSRARKQAYRNELELEVERLKEENAKLRKQLQQQVSEVTSDHYPKKSTLKRTTTAPF